MRKRGENQREEGRRERGVDEVECSRDWGGGDGGGRMEKKE